MRRVPRIILVIIMVLTIMFIWGNSILSKDISSVQSGFVMKLITPLLEIFTGKGNVTQHLVRKLAHFTEYTVLGVEAGALFGFLIKQKRCVWVSFPMIILCGMATAVIDETIQIFSGRGPAITDVWIDTAGAALGSAIMLLIAFLAKRSKRYEE